MVTEGMGIAVNETGDYGNEKGFTVEEPYAFYAHDRANLEAFYDNLPPEWRLPATHAWSRTGSSQS